MSEEREIKSAAESLNFKKLWNKQYSDLVGGSVSKQSRLTPEQVMTLFVKYFEWAENNALKAGESASFQGRVYQDTVHKPRVFTWTGLQLFCCITPKAIEVWRNMPGFDVVIEFAESVIKEQKYQLAVNGMINSSMISKELGIDKGIQIGVNASANAEAEVNTEDAMKSAVESVLGKL